MQLSSILALAHHWLKFSQNYGSYGYGGYWNGALGYSNYGCAWSNCMAETPSGLVQMVFDGVKNDPAATTDDELRFQAALQIEAVHRIVIADGRTVAI